MANFTAFGARGTFQSAYRSAALNQLNKIIGIETKNSEEYGLADFVADVIEINAMAVGQGQ